MVSDDEKGLRYFVDTSIGQFTVILVWKAIPVVHTSSTR